jgi:hypothetical protein
MTRITTRIVVTEDGRISSAVPLPVGNHAAVVDIVSGPIRQRATEPFDIDALPLLDLGPWPDGLALRREDMYGDDGR